MKALIISLLAATLSVGCATQIVPQQQLEAMGIQAFTELKQNKPIVTDRRVNDYVQCVARSVVAPLGPGNWEVVVFQDDEANAFALPGGKIGVHTGLLKIAENQDQLATVIGHEVGHVLANHSGERLSQATQAQIGTQAAGMALRVLLPEYADLVGTGVNIGSGLLLRRFSREHESEADLIGIDLMARAGFDPTQSVALWQNMAREAAGREPPELLSTHPGSGTRIQDLQANMPPAVQMYQSSLAQGRRPRC